LWATNASASSSSTSSPTTKRPLAVVGFDTATADTAVCAARDGEVLHESLLGLSPEGKPRHATVLLEEVERAVDVTGGWGSIDLIAVGLGPGSFTGVRIGIATAQGLSASRGLPVAGVCTLDAIGRGLRQADPGVGVHLAVLDARRSEVFAALYSATGERVWAPAVSTPAALAERIGQLSQPPPAAGSGAVRFRHELAGLGVAIADDADPVHRVAARHICAIAAAGDSGSTGTLAPIYLRPPDAERWRERDSVDRAE
jgi:tRNA threonylcarbamoyl adenosine modification protein YeaZ